MKTIAMYVYGGLSLGLLATSAAVSNPRISHASAVSNIGQTPGAITDVHVTNTTAQAVPVIPQGVTTVKGTVATVQSGAWNVGITGTPAVTVSGTPTVAVSGTPSVKVLNPATSPVPVALVNEGARQPFQQQVQMVYDNSGFASGYITVPAGWRLVIEHINAYGFILEKDGISDYQLDVTYKGSPVAYEFNPEPTSDADHYHTAIDRPIVAYADSGSQLAIRMEPSVSGPGAPTPSGWATISGYLEK